MPLPLLAGQIVKFMQATQFPGGLGSIGFTERDLDALVEGTWPQQRVIRNAPREVSRDDLRELFRGAMAYW